MSFTFDFENMTLVLTLLQVGFRANLRTGGTAVWAIYKTNFSSMNFVFVDEPPSMLVP
jgi:hypothetical protein